MKAEGLALLGHVGRIGVDRQKVGELTAKQFIRLALEVVGTGPGRYAPYSGQSRIDLNDPGS